MRGCITAALLNLACFGYIWAAPIPLWIEGRLAAPAEYGLAQLERALGERGVELARATGVPSGRGVVVGVAASGSRMAGWAAAERLTLAPGPEALAVKRLREGEAELLVFAGSDPVGLMYALLDAAEEVEKLGRDADWFLSVREVSEKPANQLRQARLLLHHEKNEAAWYHDKGYWDWYLGTLSRDRFNGLNLVFAHQTPYLAPMFAWHFVVPEYPEVRGKGVTDEDMARNLETLKYIAAECERRGIDFCVGIWQYLPWSRENLVGRGDQRSLVEGLTIRNVTEYTYLATKRLLAEVPGIKRIQLRFSSETGLERGDQYYFYKNGLFPAIAEASPAVELDMRMGGGPRAVRELARELGIPYRISQKYNGEFMGLPHPPAEILCVGYSYSDYLRYPRECPVYNEVWALGSHRVLLWGSEEYGRQFGRAASFGGTIGFEVDMPMGQKGYQDEEGEAWRFFKHAEDEYFKHEMERYWAYLRAYGRFSYDPEADHEVWMRPFRRRFGAGAEAMAAAYEAAGRVVWLIVASHINNTNMYAWPEKSMGGLPNAYLEIGGMDRLHFPTIKAQVEEELGGLWSGCAGAERLAAEFDGIADAIERALGEAEAAVVDRGKEYAATVNDFRILMHLARFHADRQREGYALAKFNATGDAAQLARARGQSEAAVGEWKALAEIGERQYYDRMNCGPLEVGHWKDSLFLVEAGPKLLEEARETLSTFGLFERGFDFGGTPLATRLATYTIKDYGNQYDVERRFTGVHAGELYQSQSGYGLLENEGLGAVRNRMVPRGNLVGDQPDPERPLPFQQLYQDFLSSRQRFSFRMDLAMEWYRLTMVFSDLSERPAEHGPFEVGLVGRFADNPIARSVRVPAGGTVYLQEDHNVRNDRFQFVSVYAQPRQAGGDAMLSGLTAHRLAPSLGHAPSRRLDPAEGRLAVTITMPPETGEGGGPPSASSRGRLASASVLVRGGEGQAWSARPLTTEDGLVYEARLSREDLSQRWVEYYFQAIDKAGKATRLPRAGSYRSRITADAAPPRVAHVPTLRGKPGAAIPIRVEAEDESGVAAVRVRYRPMNQRLSYQSLELEARDGAYYGAIPGEAIDPEFDFIYCIEAVDEAGNGCFFPDWRKTAPYYIVAVER